MLKDINVTGTSYPYGFTTFNNVFFFQANDGIHGNELWQSDGTEAGTVLAKDINKGGDSSPYGFISMSETFFFSADDSTTGHEFWFWGSKGKFYVIPRDNGGVIIYF